LGRKRREIDIKAYCLDIGDLKIDRPDICGNITEMALRAGYRRPESILRHVPAGKMLIPVMCLVCKPKLGGGNGNKTSE